MANPVDDTPPVVTDVDADADDGENEPVPAVEDDADVVIPLQAGVAIKT